MNLKMRNATLKSATFVLGLSALIFSFQNCSGVGFNQADSLSEKSAASLDDSDIAADPDVSEEPDIPKDPDPKQPDPKDPVACNYKSGADISHVMGEFVVCGGVVEHISHVHPHAVVYLVNSRLDDVSHVHKGGRVVLINSKAPKRAGIVSGTLTDDLVKKCGREKLKSSSAKLDIPHIFSSESVSADQVTIAHVHGDNGKVDLTARAGRLHISHIHPNASVVWLAQ